MAQKEIRLAWSHAKGQREHGAWHYGRPRERKILGEVAASGNRERGGGSHWIEERAARQKKGKRNDWT